MSNPHLDLLAQFACELAQIARPLVLEAANSPRRPEYKSDESPVTATDRAVEHALRQRIEATFPDHGILGEEYGGKDLFREFVWVLDPIDGTRAFVGGFAVYGTLIALTQNGKPILGVIDNPTTDERWLGVAGRSTTLNGREIKTSPTRHLAQSLLTNGNPDSLSPPETQAFSRLHEAAHWCLYGGSCVAYGRVADGSLDIAVDGGLDPYDYCALVPVIEGAGGVISDWTGKPLTLASGRVCVVATNSPQLHELTLNQLTL